MALSAGVAGLEDSENSLLGESKGVWGLKFETCDCVLFARGGAVDEQHYTLLNCICAHASQLRSNDVCKQDNSNGPQRESTKTEMHSVSVRGLEHSCVGIQR